MFTVMALFACAWTMVEGFYRAPEEVVLADLTSNLASFLLVYIGGLLMLEARSTASLETKTVPLQSFGLVLLVIIVAPKEFSMSLPGGASFGLSLEQTKAAISLAFDLASSISIALGAKEIYKRPLPFIFLLLILGCYIIMDTQHYGYLIIGARPSGLTQFELEAYAFLKAALTLTFGCMVVDYGMSNEDRIRGWRYWILHFFALAGRAATEHSGHCTSADSRSVGGSQPRKETAE
jgi:hypothetical protein